MKCPMILILKNMILIDNQMISHIINKYITKTRAKDNHMNSSYSAREKILHKPAFVIDKKPNFSLQLWKFSLTPKNNH